jgi:hypothetical protein
MAIQLDLVSRRVFFKRGHVLRARKEVLKLAARDFVLHVSLDLFALRKHDRVETFEWDDCFLRAGCGPTERDDE